MQSLVYGVALGFAAATAVWLWAPAMVTDVDDWVGPPLTVTFPQGYARLDAAVKTYMGDSEDLQGPESWFFGNRSDPAVPYAFNEKGWLVRAASLGRVERVARLGGRPLSGRWVEGGRAVVFADVLRGLLRWDPASGSVEVLASVACDGSVLAYVDDVRATAQGDLLFTSASIHSPFWRLQAARGAAGAAAGPVSPHAEQDVPVRLELLAGGRGTGRLLRLRAPRDPVTGEAEHTPAGRVAYGSCAETAVDGLRFANGVALAPADEDQAPGVPARRWAWPGGGASDPAALVTASFAGRVARVGLGGPPGAPTNANVDREWSSALPALPDNVSPGPDGTWLVALPSPRSASVWLLSVSRWARWAVSRLPWWLWPPSAPFGGVLQLDAQGRPLRSWVDPDGSAAPFVTSATWVGCDAAGAAGHGSAVGELCDGAAPGHGVMLLGSIKTSGLKVLHVPPGVGAPGAAEGAAGRREL